MSAFGTKPSMIDVRLTSVPRGTGTFPIFAMKGRVLPTPDMLIDHKGSPAQESRSERSTC
jgi:hypothetical protein